MNKSKYFISWYNIKRVIIEFFYIFSSRPSFFSKKRLESAAAFFIGQMGMIYYIYKNVDIMTSSDMLIWAGIEFAISGYMISKIERNKKPLINNSDNIDDNSDNNNH